MRSLILSLLVIAVTALPGFARGRSNSANGHVVHSRRAPVIIHRAVPPFSGVHVYQKPAKAEGSTRRAARARNAELMGIEGSELSPTFDESIHPDIDYHADH